MAYPSHRNVSFPGPHISRTNKPNRGERHLNCRFVPEFDVQNGCTLGFQRCSTAQLQVCSGVQMPLSPLVSAEVPAVGVAVQDPLSGLEQPFPFLATHRTSEPNHRVNSRRF